MSTTTEELVFQKFKQLPPERHQEVLDFLDSLEPEQVSPPQMGNPFGLWADLDIEITEEDIAQVRQEMWGNFPREDV